MINKYSSTLLLCVLFSTSAHAALTFDEEVITVEKKAVAQTPKKDSAPKNKPKEQSKPKKAEKPAKKTPPPSTINEEMEEYEDIQAELDAMGGEKEGQEKEPSREEWEKWNVSYYTDYDSLEVNQSKHNQLLIFKYNDDKGFVKPKPKSIHAQKDNTLHKLLGNSKSIFLLGLGWLFMAIAVVLFLKWGWTDAKEKKQRMKSSKKKK